MYIGNVDEEIVALLLVLIFILVTLPIVLEGSHGFICNLIFLAEEKESQCSNLE